MKELIYIATNEAIFGLPALLRRPQPANLPPHSYAATNGKDIFLNEKTMGGLIFRMRIAVILHEALHILLGHIPRGVNKNQHLWNIAADIVVNNLLIQLGYPLPPGSIYNYDWKDLTTEQIYNKLLQEKKSVKVHIVRDGEGRGVEAEISIETILIDKPNKWDIHEYDKISQKEAEEFTRRVAMEATLLKSRGTMPASFWEEISQLEVKPLPWHVLLRKYIVESLPSDIRFLPLGKKSHILKIPLPGVVKGEGVTLTLAIDTSGSMSQTELGKIAGVLDQLSKEFEVEGNVILCDAEIQKILPLKEWLKKPVAVGRGGTDYEPIFEKLKKERYRGLLIMLTDGECPFPKKPPFDIIWVFTSPKKKAPYGKSVYIE